MARKKTERKPKNIGEAVGFVNLLSNEKVDFVLGIVVLAYFFAIAPMLGL